MSDQGQATTGGAEGRRAEISRSLQASEHNLRRRVVVPGDFYDVTADVVRHAAAECDRLARALEEAQARKVWRCFHCDEVFTDEAEAREHFGADYDVDPMCAIKADDGGLPGEIRRLEAELLAALNQRNEHARALEEAQRELSSDRAFCICGCPNAEHENYGEDGEACEHDDHECLRVTAAAVEIAKGLRARAEQAEAENQRLAQAVTQGAREQRRLEKKLVEATEVNTPRARGASGKPAMSETLEQTAARLVKLVTDGTWGADTLNASILAALQQAQASDVEALQEEIRSMHRIYRARIKELEQAQARGPQWQAQHNAIEDAPPWLQTRAGSELDQLVRIVRFAPGQATGFLHSDFDAAGLLWRWALKWFQIPAAAPPVAGTPSAIAPAAPEIQGVVEVGMTMCPACISDDVRLRLCSKHTQAVQPSKHSVAGQTQC